MDVAADAEFTEFMLGAWPRLVRLGYALTGDRGLAEDLAQTALARAYAAWPRVMRAGDPDAYVRKIVVNASRDRFRKRRVDELLTDSPPDAPATGPAGQADSFDDRAALLAALLRLPAGQRAAVVLRYWLDLTETEAAALLGCSVGNVKSQASRALAKLRLDTALAPRAVVSECAEGPQQAEGAQQ
ncbi:MAG: SigE family RNA polymerase sigma factor [Actinomycetota bacterium]|nr:SigE family RNA polymerase sigma factor [Actinomycetota bacterium]